MLEETLPAIPASTLSDFAVWKVKESDELACEAEVHPSFYPAASLAMGLPLPANRSKWVLFLLCVMVALVALPFCASPTVPTVDIPKTWTDSRRAMHRVLPNNSMTRQNNSVRPTISNRLENAGSMLETFNYTAKYGLPYVFVPVKIIVEVRRTVSHWIDMLREAFGENIYVDLE
jgi:hypothetical protein